MVCTVRVFAKHNLGLVVDLVHDLDWKRSLVLLVIVSNSES
jgi:hypothetical protein